jgi:hypothetical protein
MPIYIESDWGDVDRELDRLETVLESSESRGRLEAVLDLGFEDTQATVHVITESLKRSGKTSSEVKDVGGDHRLRRGLRLGERPRGLRPVRDEPGRRARLVPQPGPPALPVGGSGGRCAGGACGVSALAAGSRTVLASDTALTDLLGKDDVWDTWIFQDRLYAAIERSGAVAVVLEARGAWTSPNMHNTMRFPRLWVGYYADPSRDAAGNVTEYDAADKIEAVHALVDRHLHRPQGGEVMWGALRVIDAHRMGEPDYFPVKDGDGMTRAEVTYGVTLG